MAGDGERVRVLWRVLLWRGSAGFSCGRLLEGFK